MAVVHKDLLLPLRLGTLHIRVSLSLPPRRPEIARVRRVGTSGTWQSRDLTLAPSHLVFIRSSARVNFFTYPLHSLRVSAGSLVQFQLPLLPSLGILKLLFIRLGRSLLFTHHEDLHSLRPRGLHIACSVNTGGSCPAAIRASCAAWCAPPYPHSRGEELVVTGMCTGLAGHVRRWHKHCQL